MTPACWSSRSRCSTRPRIRFHPSTFGRNKSRRWWRGGCLGSGCSVAQRSAVSRARGELWFPWGNSAGRWWRSPRCATRRRPSAPRRSSHTTGPGGSDRRPARHTPGCPWRSPPPAAVASPQRPAGSAGCYPSCSAAGGSIWLQSPSWKSQQRLQLSHTRHSYQYL